MGTAANRPCWRRARAEGKELEEMYELHLGSQTIFHVSG